MTAARDIIRLPAGKKDRDASASKLAERIEAYWAERNLPVKVWIVGDGALAGVRSEMVMGLPKRTTAERIANQSNEAARIIKRVEAETGICFADMKSKKRKRPISLARAKAMLELRETPQSNGEIRSFPKIAAMFGRDHTTVIHNCNAEAARRAACREAGE